MNLYIVTGTRRGLGEALAKRITADKRNELIGISRPDVDLADPASIARAFEAIGKRIAATTYEKAVLINNAGVIEPVAPLDRADPGDIEHNLAVNLVAPMLLMRLFLGATEHVKLRRGINISRAPDVVPCSDGRPTAPPRRGSTWPRGWWRSRRRCVALRSRP
jgi:benzil reductase ((S)-benzoin forming)